MNDEILLSESNLERVWMDAGWNTRVEPTELGEWFFALRADRSKAAARSDRRGRWGAVLIGVVVGASSVAALLRVL